MKSKVKNIDEVCGKPSGSFKKSVGDHSALLAKMEKDRAKIIRKNLKKKN